MRIQWRKKYFNLKLSKLFTIYFSILSNPKVITWLGLTRLEWVALVSFHISFRCHCRYFPPSHTCSLHKSSLVKIYLEEMSHGSWVSESERHEATGMAWHGITAVATATVYSSKVFSSHNDSETQRHWSWSWRERDRTGRERVILLHKWCMSHWLQVWIWIPSIFFIPRTGIGATALKS